MDIDDVCFGDRLYILALTNMAFLASKWETDYIRYWSDAWLISEMKRYMTRLYAAAVCVDFIGGLGMRFNKTDVTIDREKETFYGDLLRSLIE